MSPRDLINIGIFAALFIVTISVFNLLEFIGPLGLLIGGAIGIVAGGVPFMLFLTRVRHAGMVTIFAVIVWGFLLVFANPPIAVVLGVVVALIAEVLLWLGGYRSRRMSVLAYAVFSVSATGPFVPLFYARHEYLSSAALQQMGTDFLDRMDTLLSPTVLIAYAVSTLVLGLIGGALGLRLLDKHFRKAGLV
ncbi:MptD family putative ECF transporter S component [Nocardia sp. NPDC051052]|uniref:MptD family putative ECF transporter S component n=1 Tax=Nocardia sp. NPDC051052 TaxID=3364322 RepID=UPI00379735DD